MACTASQHEPCRLARGKTEWTDIGKSHPSDDRFHHLHAVLSRPGNERDVRSNVCRLSGIQTELVCLIDSVTVLTIAIKDLLVLATKRCLFLERFADDTFVSYAQPITE